MVYFLFSLLKMHGPKNKIETTLDTMRVMCSIVSCSLIKRMCRIIHAKYYIISICIFFSNKNVYQSSRISVVRLFNSRSVVQLFFHGDINSEILKHEGRKETFTSNNHNLFRKHTSVLRHTTKSISNYITILLSVANRKV